MAVAVVVLVDISVVELVAGVIAGVMAGVEAVECSMVVLELLLELCAAPPAGDGFTTVVLFSVFEGGAPAAGVTVSDFCSHAARRAALARMQMYFFIGV